MKHFVAGITTLAVVALTSAAFAQTSLTASVTFEGQDIPTTFGLYTDNDGTNTAWTAIELDNGASGGISLSDDVRYVATQNYYVDVDPGNYGNWYLCVYTDTASSLTFNPEGGSNLFLYDGSGQSCIWKYRNAAIFDPETRAKGATIPAADWSGNDALYKYFVNVPSPGTAAEIAAITTPTEDVLGFSSIVNYKTSWDYDVYIAMTFAIDMSTVIRQGQYTANVVFEVYYE